jgi:hypothetical protein
MAVTYSIDTDQRIVILTTIGDSSFAEWSEAMLEVLAAPQYRPGFNFLSDRRQQTSVPTTDFARGAAIFLQLHSAEMGNFRWAAVSNTSAIYGMQRMFSIYSEMKGVQARAFNDYQEALEWVHQ